MYTKIPVGDISREKWLELRRTGIGGSDAGAVCGMNPYSSPMKVYQDKTCGRTEETESEAVRQGNDLEDYVARRFMEATGLKVRRSHYMYRSVEYPFMIADVDRLVAGEDAGLECKTASAYSADQWKDGNIPPHYVLQCYHYMAVTGKRAWYLAAVILGSGFVCRKLEWDDGLIRQMVGAEKHFWENHVEKGVMPAPDGSESCGAVLGQYFHTARKGSAVALAGFDEKLDRREEIIRQMTELQREQERIEQEIKMYMQDNETAANDRYKVTWANVESTRLDTGRIRQERPELYREYARKSVSRRFQVRVVPAGAEAETGRVDREEGENGTGHHTAA